MDAAIILFVLLLLAGKKPSSPKMVQVTSETERTGSGRKVDIKATWPGDIGEWARSRYAAAHAYLTDTLGMTDPDAHEAALSVLAHWSIETGAGTNEYNFNVGGIHAAGNQDYFVSTDQNEKGEKVSTNFAAYASLADGVAAYFAVLSSPLFKSCLETLKAGPTQAGWYKCLGQAGYYAKTYKGKDNIEPAAALWATKRAALAQYAAE